MNPPKDNLTKLLVVVHLKNVWTLALTLAFNLTQNHQVFQKIYEILLYSEGSKRAVRMFLKSDGKPRCIS